MRNILIMVALLMMGSVAELQAQGIIGRAVRRAASNAIERNVTKQVEKAVDKAVDEAFEEIEKDIEEEVEEIEKEIIETAEEIEAVQEEIENEEETIFKDAVDFDEYDFSIDYELVADPFFGYKKGVKLTFADLDKKGKPTAHTMNEITKLEGEAPFNCTVEYTVTLLDDKKNSLGITPMVQSYSIRNGIVTFDEN
ncbi:MAG: hypothetical protein E7065_11820, partial [Lentimicrobiaceae bacterium]|nr:hypothetical protein [Lentimicrobiaceae bacterium]